MVFVITQESFFLFWFLPLCITPLSSIIHLLKIAGTYYYRLILILIILIYFGSVDLRLITCPTIRIYLGGWRHFFIFCREKTCGIERSLRETSHFFTWFAKTKSLLRRPRNFYRGKKYILVVGRDHFLNLILI